MISRSAGDFAPTRQLPPKALLGEDFGGEFQPIHICRVALFGFRGQAISMGREYLGKIEYTKLNKTQAMMASRALMDSGGLRERFAGGPRAIGGRLENSQFVNGDFVVFHDRVGW